MTTPNMHPGVAWHNKMGEIVVALAAIDEDLTTVTTALGYGTVLTELAGLALQAKTPFEKAEGEAKAARDDQQTGANSLTDTTLLDGSHPSLLNAREEANKADEKLNEAAEDYAAVGGIMEYESPLIALIGETLARAQATMLSTGPAIQTIREAAATGQQNTSAS